MNPTQPCSSAAPADGAHLATRRHMLGAALFSALPGLACARQGLAAAGADGSGARMSGPPLAWTALMAPGWDPASYFRSLPAAQIRDLEDDDPRARLLLQRLVSIGRQAPPSTSLDGQRVLLLGLAKPVESPANGRAGRALFMPYLDGCIHRPPPPANQMVLIVPPEGIDEALLPYRLWLEGTLRVQPSQTPAGYAAWSMRDARVSRFDEEGDRQWLAHYPQFSARVWHTTP